MLIKPSAKSGFSWQVRHDVNVGARGSFSSRVDMSSPVTVIGELGYQGADAMDPELEQSQGTLSGAEVLAFAVIDDDSNGERAVGIGRTTADDQGNFMLLLPQSIKPEW